MLARELESFATPVLKHSAHLISR